ncbi:MAG: helix-turn-helix domain-containing protein [Myxococcota bacterium]
MAASVFGRMLRAWRQRRGLSQLSLATEAGTSPRHLSFLETGRSRPGHDLVVRLADALQIPARERDDLLEAAGLPTAGPAPFEPDALEPFLRAVGQLLEKHAPYPGCALDGYGQVVQVNAAFERLWPGATGMTPEQAVDAFFAPGPARSLIENWTELAWRSVDLRRREAARSGDPRALDLAERAARHLASVPRPAEADTPREPVFCPRFRLGDRVLRTFTTVMRFEHADDLGLRALKVELIFPADPAAAAFFEQSA